MSAALHVQDHREQLYHWLKLETSVSPNHEWLACIVASWLDGQSVLPDDLGLESCQFKILGNYFFPHAVLPEHAPSGSELDFSRMLEKDDLSNLLKRYSNPELPETDWIIAIIVAGCLGNDHLWQDLGLWSRAQLTALLQYNFPELAAKNSMNMKWKKFLYKQLCEEEGIYVCRAPSCEVCIDYPKCFGDEN